MIIWYTEIFFVLHYVFIYLVLHRDLFFFFFAILSFIHPLRVLYYVACWLRLTKKLTKMITEERQWTVCFRIPSFSIFLFGLLSLSIFVAFCCVLILRGLQCFSFDWVARKNMYITSFWFLWCPLFVHKCCLLLISHLHDLLLFCGFLSYLNNET